MDFAVLFTKAWSGPGMGGTSASDVTRAVAQHLIDIAVVAQHPHDPSGDTLATRDEGAAADLGRRGVVEDRVPGPGHDRLVFADFAVAPVAVEIAGTQVRRGGGRGHSVFLSMNAAWSAAHAGSCSAISGGMTYPGQSHTTGGTGSATPGT